jgi:hypothetical protein
MIETEQSNPVYPDLAPIENDAPLPDDVLAGLRNYGIAWSDIFRFALASVRNHPLRSALTTLGVMIGVAAVVALIAIGRGTQVSITSMITANGANLLTVRSGASNQGGVVGAVGQGQSLTLKDARALADPMRVPDAAAVSPEFYGNAQIVAGAGNMEVRVIGVEPEYALVHNTSVVQGEFISDNDVRSLAGIVVLGANVAETLFPEGDAVGQRVRLGGQHVQVVGVLEKKGGSGFSSVDDSVLVPLSTAQRRLFNGRAISGGSFLGLSYCSAGAQRRSHGSDTRGSGDCLARRAQAAAGWQRRRFQHHQSGGHPGDGDADDPDADPVSCSNRRNLAAGWRHRHHEHHAGVGA